MKWTLKCMKTHIMLRLWDWYQHSYMDMSLGVLIIFDEKRRKVRLICVKKPNPTHYKKWLCLTNDKSILIFRMSWDVFSTWKYFYIEKLKLRVVIVDCPYPKGSHTRVCIELIVCKVLDRSHRIQGIGDKIR